MKNFLIIFIFQYCSIQNVFAFNCLAPKTQLTESSKLKKISSINTPGLLIHGVRFSDEMPDNIRLLKIESIFTRGLLPENEIWKIDSRLLSYRNWYYQGLNPEFVSLDMISKDGYRASAAAFTYGSSSDKPSSRYNFTIILDPLFVQNNENVKDFTATGDAFDYFNYRYKDVSEKGRIYNGIQQSRYHGHPKNGAKPLTFEVVNKFVPIKAFAGIIVDEIYAQELKTIVDSIFPNNNIQYFTPDDKAIQFTKESKDNQLLDLTPRAGVFGVAEVVASPVSVDFKNGSLWRKSA